MPDPYVGQAGRRRTQDCWADIRRIVLSGGRCAARAEQRNFIKRSRKNGARIVPTRNLWSGGDPGKRDPQRGSMQRLANVANGIRSAIVMVQKAATTRKIQQRQANQRCANPAQFFSGQTCTEFSHISVIKIH